MKGNTIDFLIGAFLFLTLLFCAVSVYSLHSPEHISTDNGRVREFTLKDGTRCVAINEKALVCDFAKPVY